MRPSNTNALTGADKQKKANLDQANANQGAQNSFSTGNVTQRDPSAEALRGGPTLGDQMMVNTNSNPYAYSFLPGTVIARENQFRNLEMAAKAAQAGLIADPSGSGAYMKPREVNNASMGGGIEDMFARSPGGQPSKNYQQDMLDFERSLYEDRARGSQQNSMDLERQRQEQKLKMEMLSKLMMQFRGGSQGSSGGAGYTEQIFNNAGRPQVVRLQNQQAGQQQQMLMQLLSRFAG